MQYNFSNSSWNNCWSSKIDRANAFVLPPLELKRITGGFPFFEILVEGLPEKLQYYITDMETIT